jgi:hypothetical protein
MNRQQAGKLALVVAAATTSSCGSSASPPVFDTLPPASADAAQTTPEGGALDGWGLSDADPGSDGAVAAPGLVDIGGGLIYDSINNVTWIADGLVFSRSIKATTSDPGTTPYTGGLLGTAVGTHMVTASDFTFVSAMGDRWFATWYGAVAWANSYTHSWGSKTISGWRLPTVLELDRLYSETGGAWCGADGCDASPGTAAPFTWIPPKAWTSTELQYVDFSHDDLHGTAAADGFSNVWVVVSGDVAEGRRPDAGAADARVGTDVKDAAVRQDLAGVDSPREAADRETSNGPITINVAPGEGPGTAKVEVALADTKDPVSSIIVSVLPDNVTASAATASLIVAGLGAQTTHTFSVKATTIAGNVLSATTTPLAFYDVIETFTEPECENNTLFRGSFTFDKQSATISNLRGTLTEAMYAGPPTVSLSYQLSTQSVSLGGASGQLVATFALDTTDTFAEGGFAPGGSKTYGNRNAYALVFVNTNDPTAPLTPEQISWLAYADCTPDGLMGKTCMTGTTTAAYGRIGTMGAYPTSQITTQR